MRSVALLLAACSVPETSGPWSTVDVMLTATDGRAQDSPGPPIRIDTVDARWTRTEWDADGPVGGRSITVLTDAPVAVDTPSQTSVEIPAGTYAAVQLGIGLGPTRESALALLVTGAQANVSFEVRVAEPVLASMALEGKLSADGPDPRIELWMDTSLWMQGLDFRDSPGDVVLPDDDEAAYAQFLENLAMSLTGSIVAP